MIGGPVPGAKEYYNEVKQKSLAIPNLEFLGAVPYGEVNQYFSRAKVFVNTSEIEGFPNSFLQAWIRGVPVVSFFDPDDLISTQGLGASPKGEVEMVKAVEHFLSDDEYRESVSSVTRAYTLENYSPQKIAARYIELIDRK
jgi:glycosyltransferase involved in cell wall biosynthesis